MTARAHKDAAGRAGTHQLRDELLQLLQVLLPDAPPKALAALTRVVLHPGQDDPVEILRQLLASGCEASSLQRALGEARDFALEKLLPAVAPQATPEMLKMLYAFLDQGDRLQGGLVQVLGEQYAAEFRQLQSRLISEGQAHLLTKARHVWEQSKGITLYNYYQELRISTYEPLYKVEPHGLVTGRSRDLMTVVAAGDHGELVHARLPESDLCLRLIVEDATPTTVHWRFAGIIEISKEKRRDIRVQVDAPTFIVLRHGERQWRGRVEEFSLQGFGISLPLADGLYKGQHLDYTLIMHMNEMDGEATLRWLSRNDGGAHAGLEIKYDHRVHALLKEQMERRRRTIVNELLLKGVPDVLL